jgi:hypothetical protein
MSNAITQLNAELAPFRLRAAELTARYLNLDPEAFPEAALLLADFERLYVDPLTAVYGAQPFDARSGAASQRDIDYEDDIWQVLCGLAGVTELAVWVGLVKDGPEEAGDQASPRFVELVEASRRHIELLVRP